MLYAHQLCTSHLVLMAVSLRNQFSVDKNAGLNHALARMAVVEVLGFRRCPVLDEDTESRAEAQTGDKRSDDRQLKDPEVNICFRHAVVSMAINGRW